MSFLDRFRKSGPPATNRPPRSGSGRGHSEGFIELEELNDDLKHPYGHKVYDRMYRTDGDVRQAVQLVCNPITGGTWTVVPFGGEQADDKAIEVAEFVRWALWTQMSPNLLGHLQQALPLVVRSGFTPFEKVWMSARYTPQTVTGGKKVGTARQVVVPRTLSVRLPRTIEQFEQDRYGELTRIKQYLPTPLNSVVGREGVRTQGRQDDSPGFVWINRQDLVYYRVGAEGDNWEGTSLLRPAYKHWFLKDKIERIDAIAQERESIGIPICYPPMGATPDQLDEVESVLESMRTNEQAYIVAPGPKAGKGAMDGQGWLFEVIGYDRTGTGRDPQPSLEYHTNKIAASFISEFMRLGHGQTGARATAQVQADPFLMSVEALVAVVETQLNDDLVAPLVAYNFPDVDNPPRLQMSLVDSTSLTQLADYVQKLAQIGALLPDQELEDFLRARADLPAANPESVKKRRKEDDQIRRDIVSGGGDPFGANDKPGKPHGTKPAGQGAQKGATGRGASLDAEAVGRILSGAYGDSEVPYAEPRERWRTLRPHELAVDLDDIEDAMDGASTYFEHSCADHVYAMARGKGDATAFPEAIGRCLYNYYDFGASTVEDEIRRQCEAFGMEGHRLDRGAVDRGGAHLDKRAKLAASQVVQAMEVAAQNADLNYGDGPHVQLAAERAGLAALRQVGRAHGVNAFQVGRHDRGVQLAAEDNGIPVVGARYTAILDTRTCEHCFDADEDVLRYLDDPVRLDRRPPNPHCASTKGGFNHCRCFEIFEVGAPDDFAPFGHELSDDQLFHHLDGTTDLPEYIRTVANGLVAKGMGATRALSTAANIAKVHCRTGAINWPGVKSMRPGSQQDACAAAAAWSSRFA